ncbi:MAG: hypothetical protein KGN36_03455 [Acidobacteriota bacterium]|nr:hypothetical protein [Acidobacteriota bacterium]
MWAADKETPFKAQPAASYAAHQTNQQITIAADPYVDTDKLKAAFGKLDPNEYGVLPVLLVMQNDSGQALRLSNMRVEYLGPNRERVEATPARDVRYVRGPQRPNMIGGPPGTKIKVIKTKKNPLDAWEVEGRGFAAQMLPAGNGASGFFYFQTTLRPGATIYVSGIAEAATGKELLYFEIPLP